MLISLRYEVNYGRMTMELMQIRPLPSMQETKEKGDARYLINKGKMNVLICDFSSDD